MAAGDHTRGVRVQHNSISDLALNEYGYAGDGALWLHLPSGDMARLDDRWTITEEEDGTLSVEPSILVTRTTFTNGDPPVGGWHGYLRHGIFEEV